MVQPTNWLTLLGRSLNRTAAALGLKPLSYEEAKRLLQHEDEAVRASLAEREDVEPEILYYLAQDPSAMVRGVIARNSATPLQADAKLATDKSDEVRAVLAGKIAKAVPHISASQQAKLRDLAFDVLRVLVEDQLPRVRQILAEELKHLDSVPKPVIDRLARDRVIDVSGPILQFSPLLDDGDLLSIIKSAPIAGALAAISRRQQVSSAVADAIVAAEDSEAIGSLLSNPSAQIREATLDLIVGVAPAHQPWHDPLVRREDLPARLVQRVAGFVSLTLLRVLNQRRDLDEETLRQVAVAVERRLTAGDEGAAPSAAAASASGAAPSSPAPAKGPELFDLDGPIAEDLVVQLHASGGLDEAWFDQMIDDGRRAHIRHALALRSGMAPDKVKAILESRQGKAIAALAWRAGLSMRLALRIQTVVGQVEPDRLIAPRKGKTGYPLPPNEMARLLDLFKAG